MKFRGLGFIVFGFGALLAASCFAPPEYSIIPSIELDNLLFKDVSDPSAADSLILTIRFKDGDGDLGLDPNADIAPPYNNKYYFQFSNGTYITYKTKRTDPRYDTLPAFVTPYNCTNWEILAVNGKTDTLYYQLNANHNNIFVDYFIKNSDGTFTEFDWVKEFTYPNCGISFDGRFPVLSKDLSHKSPMEGTLRYGMTSVGFLILFSIKTLKLRVTIQDRALHRSNTIDTQEFTLQSIKR